MKKSVGELILRGTIIIQVFMILAKVIGVLQKMVIGYYVGTSMEADTYMWAFSGLIFTFIIIPHKLVAPVLPVFIARRKADGEAAAWQFLGVTGLLLALGIGTAVLAGIAAAPQLVRAVSQYATNTDQFKLAVILVRIMLPAAFFMGLFAFAVLIMHADKRFALPAFGETANRLAIIVVTLLLFSAIGVKSIAVGVVLGSVSCFLLLVFALRDKLHFIFSRPCFQDPSLRQLRTLVPPVLLGIVIAQGRSMLDLWFVSGMAEGHTASLMYAKGLADTLVLLIAFPVGIVAYPYFADLVSEANRHKAANALMDVLRMMVFVFIPISVGIIILRFPIVRLMFERGKFVSDSVDLTTGPFLLYAVGLTAFAIEIVLMRFYFATKDTLTPITVGIVCTVIHIAIVYSLCDSWSHRSIALATVIAKSTKVVILYWLLKSKIPSLQVSKNALFVLKTALSAAAMAAVVHFVYGGVNHMLPTPSDMAATSRAMRLAIQLSISVAAGGAIFATAALLLRIEEATTIVHRIRRGLH